MNTDNARGFGSPDDFGKKDFSDTYLAPCPRAYFMAMSEVSYVLPGNASGHLASLMMFQHSILNSGLLNVVDLGCSYGVNAAILLHGKTMGSLFSHYSDRYVYCQNDDMAFLGERRHLRDIVGAVVGIDVSAGALEYATTVGLIDKALCRNYEVEEAIPDRGVLLDTHLIMSTGTIGYVTQTTLCHMLAATNPQKPWIASYVLRMYPLEAFSDALRDRGYLTARINGTTVVQRAFSDPSEKTRILSAMDANGIDNILECKTDNLHADLYLSIPLEYREAVMEHYGKNVVFFE